jgi:hypothetical protein
LKPDELKNIREGKPTGDAKRDSMARFARKLAETAAKNRD